MKHALPVLDPAVPASDWHLGAEGEHQSRRLALRLRAYHPLRLVASPEPKAAMTGRIVAAELGLEAAVAAGLQELDRPTLPVMNRAEHERANAPIFENPDRRVLGKESAREALTRFSRAIRRELAETQAETLAAITHGTVIALFVAAHNEIDGFALWKRLGCPSFVILDVPSYCLRDVVPTVS